MKTRFIQIAALLLLLGGPGLAGAATADTPAKAQIEAAPAVQQVQPDRDRLAWQRVGSPSSLEG